MSKHLKKVLLKARDENGNYVTIDMSTGLRKTNVQTKQSTTINKPQRKQNIKRTLKPGQQVFTDWRTGKKIVFAPRRAEVKSDNRSEYQKQEDQKTADILHQKHEQEKTVQDGLKNLDAIGKVISPSTYIGPLANRAIASVQGDKQDHRSIGEQILSGEGTGDTAGNLLLDFTSPYVFSKLPNATKQLYKAARYANNKVLDNLGSAAIYANGLGFDGTVGKSFFRDPNKAYRITEYPEVQGIREVGKNVTTRDADSKIMVPANKWRLSAFDNYAYSKDGSWYKLPKSVSQYEEENPFSFVDIGNTSDPVQVRLATKTGSAHGNMSQASLGKPWEGGLSTSGGLFPRGILEIQGGNKIAVGKDRSHFSLKDWDDALTGSRVGYKTGEMPLDNLTWYQRLPNGRYTMGEPVLPNKTIQIKPSAKQQRLQLDKPTWQIYPGKTHKISEVIDDSGNVNLANLFKIQNEALSHIPGRRLARHRLENSDWHKTDWNTFLHSRDAYQRALQAEYPNEALFPTLMHDAGKLWAGDGHGPYGASIVKQIFPDATDEQIMAIYQHMDKVPESAMGKLVKGADISEDNPFRSYSWANQNDGYPYALRPGQKSWDTNIIQDELKQGRKDLVDWINNPEFIKAQQQNKAEAQQMGFEYIPLHERSTFKDRLSLLDDANTYKWYANNKASESGYVENPLGNYANLMHINLANVDPYRFTISHEGGHMLGMGGPDLPSSSPQSILKQLKYLKYKSRQVLKPGYWYNDQFDLSEYPYEAVQNLRNLGQELNLSVGQQYPGYKNALDIINNSGKTTHSFLKPYLKTDEESMPYVWKALVGTQFGLSPIYANMLDNEKYNSGKDIRIKPSKRGTFIKAAKQHGMSVQGFANNVLKNPSKYSAAMRKKANFARNASKWNH